MHLHETSHPTDDPKLVSYVRPELRALDPELQRTRDCFTLMRTGNPEKTLGKYLPQEEGEPDAAYSARLKRSTYTAAFRDSIRAFAGILSQYQLKELPQTLEENLGNVDLLGSSLAKFLNTVDQLVTRDGGCAVMVDMPAMSQDPEQTPNSALEEVEQGIRPYLIAVERHNLINWRTSMRDGREILEQAVIRMLQELPAQEGDFGAELEPVYIHLKPGYWCKYRMDRTAVSWQMVKIEEGYTTVADVPLIWYGATGSKFADGEVPLVGLADLSIQHLQLRSDLAELVHKLSMPVPVRIGAPMTAAGQPVPLTMGPNSAVDLPLEGNFFFAEPTGGSLAQHQQEIQHVEQLMDRSSLTFMYGGEGGTRTATEVMMSGAQVQAQIATMIENKQSAFASLLDLWTGYSAEELHDDACLEVSDNLIQRPLDPGESQALLGMFSANALSHQTLLEELQRGHVLSEYLDIEEELNRIEEEKKKAQEEAIALMQSSDDDPAQFAPKPAPGADDQEDKTDKNGEPVTGAAAAAKAKAATLPGNKE